ncbi:MAG TPA: hypothetical protein VHO25_15850 [Polyangiaceae bacterium]|nr:hypothetical protein [Polyangiaceae bacterium]
MRVFVEVRGFGQIKSGFSQFGRLAQEPQPILEAVAERAFYPIVQEIFDSEGRGRWPENTPAYEEAKTKKYGDRPIMQATTALVTSLTKKNATMNIHTAQGRNSLLLGSAIHYSRFASKRRPVLMFGQPDFNRMGQEATKEFKDRGRGLGFQVK